MALRLTAAERRAFNDGLQAALLAICVEKIAGVPPRCEPTGMASRRGQRSVLYATANLLEAVFYDCY